MDVTLYTINVYKGRENAPSVAVFARNGAWALKTLTDLGCPENVAQALIYLASKGAEASEPVGGKVYQVEKLRG